MLFQARSGSGGGSVGAVAAADAADAAAAAAAAAGENLGRVYAKMRAFCYKKSSEPIYGAPRPRY